jgi:glycosyltransferase involved in cell wall biosynthesis
VRRQRLARPLYMPVINAVLRRSARILVPTTAHLEVSDELRPFRAKTAIVPFGVDHRLFAPPERQGREPVEGLFVGRLVGYKGLDVLLRAVAGTSLKVAIAGDGPLKEDLRSLASELGLEGQVRFLGEVSAEELPGLYREAGYFVLPSVTSAEMFGIVLTEAMASGLPVVYTDLETGVKEVPLEGVTGLRVPRGDSGALAGAMLRLTNEDKLRVEMGRAARGRVEELFTLDGMVASHLRLYDEVCG